MFRTMMMTAGLAISGLALGWVPAVHATAPMPAELPDIVERILPTVVNISSTTVSRETVYGMDDFMRFWGIPMERPQSSLGSGFLIGDGKVITNNHVVEHAAEVIVTLQDKKQYSARLLGRDPKFDIALLQLRDKDRSIPRQLSAAKLGDSDKARIAEGVIAIGNPFGLQSTVTSGIISAKHRTIGMGPFDNFLQTDAAINPGNSGGPLFNLKGEVIGINTLIISPARQHSGLGFAIPINEAKRLIPDLEKYGRIPRPWLGILGERVTPQLSAYYGLPRTDGVLIYNLVEQGPADTAGIQQGDILVEVDETPVKELYDVERILARHKPTDRVTLKFQRGRKPVVMSLRLEELPPRLDKLPQGII